MAGPCARKHDAELADDGALPDRVPTDDRRYAEQLASHCLRLAAFMRGVGDKARARKLSEKAAAMVVGLRSQQKP